MIPLQLKAAWAVGKVWILLAATLLVLGVGFYGGKRWEHGNTEEAKRERDSAIHTSKQWEQRAITFESATKRWESRYADDQRRAREQAEQAGRLLAELEVQKRKATAEKEEWRKRYNEALKTPDCADLVKETRCAAFFRY